MRQKISYQDRVEEALSNGKIWRALEILQGRIGSLPYDPECLEMYGKVLLQMGDKLKAGRFLFASGTESLEYKEAIDLFLQQNKATIGFDLWLLLPKSLRKVQLEKLPHKVQIELSIRGLKKDEIKNIVNKNISLAEKLEPTRWRNIKENLTQILILAILGWILIALFTGSALMIKSFIRLMLR